MGSRQPQVEVQDSQSLESAADEMRPKEVCLSFGNLAAEDRNGNGVGLIVNQGKGRRMVSSEQ